MERKPWICLDCRILMDLIDEDHCKCHKCGTEVWYQYSEPEKEEIEDMMMDSIVRQDNDSQSILMGGAVVKRGGGSKSKGRSNKKQLMQKLSTNQLYRELLSK